MIITNKLNLPRAFVEMATENYSPEPNIYRVTEILKGTCEAVLTHRHGNAITQDVSDMIWLLFGTATHSILERQTEADSELKESRIKMPVGKYILSGQFDLYDAEAQTLSDYKTCSVWKVIKQDYSDWRKQLLMYAVLMQYAGFPVKQGRIIALMKDHSKSKAKYDSSYPQHPVQVIPFKFSEKDFAGIREFIKDRFAKISIAEQLSDNALSPCTPEERYNDGDKFAVMKKGRKRALKVCSSESEAKEYMLRNGGDSIEKRPGEDKKCKDYCAVHEFCPYYRMHVKEG